jgi:hypothetical protein
VTWSSWPASTHNDGDLDDNEYEKLAVPYSANGIIGSPADTALAYGDSSGRQVKTRGGRYVLVRGRLGYSGGSDSTFSVGANVSGSTRYDLLVAGVDRGSDYEVSAYVKAGTPGSGPPATEVAVGTTGKYEIPLATIRVVNNATTIEAADVVPVGWFVAPPPIVCIDKDKRPPAARGLRIYQNDTKTWYWSDGTNWIADLPDTPWVTFTPAAGWNVGSAGCRVKTRAGFASLICEVSRVGALAANVDSVIATLDVAYRPGAASGLGAPLIAWVNGALGLGIVKPDGRIILANSPTLATGALVEFHIATWPIG